MTGKDAGVATPHSSMLAEAMPWKGKATSISHSVRTRITDFMGCDINMRLLELAYEPNVSRPSQRDAPHLQISVADFFMFAIQRIGSAQ